jgi:hypothetical protein
LNAIGCGLLPKGAAFRFKEQAMMHDFRKRPCNQVKSSSAKKDSAAGRAFSNKCNNKNDLFLI